MIGKRNLGKAVVLGLLLSTGMYGAALAADEQEIRDERIWEPNVNVQLENKDLIIRDDKTAVGFNGTIDIKNGDLIIEASGASSNGIESGYLSDKAELQIYADNIDITSGANGMYTVLGDGKGGNIILGSEDRKIQGLTIESGGQGIDNKNGNVYIYGTDDSQFYIHSLNTSGKNSNQAAINNSAYKGEISMTGGSIRLQTDKVDKGYGDGITNSTGTTTLNFNSIEMDVTGNGICNTSGTVSLNTESSNAITSDQRGIYNTSSGTVYLNTKGSNTITSAQQGIYAEEGTVDVNGAINSIKAGDLIQDGENNQYGTNLAINAGYKYELELGGHVITTIRKNGIVNLIASDGDNTLNGAVYAIGDETNVQISGLADENGNYGNSRYNYVGSAAVIENAGGLKKDDSGKFTNTEVVSALYAEEGANIVVSGERNEFRSYAADPTDTGTLERTIWAYDKANIEINGSTLISTDRYEETAEAQKGNSADIAIAAGTAVNLTKDMVNAEIDDAERAKVTLNYGANSEIKGDILAAYAGQVDIAAKSDVTRSNSAKIDITGNLLAGNNGVLNVNLGNGGTLIGRADDYGDAGTVENNDHGTTFFNPAFSSEILTGGEVNLTMGEGSKWTVTGQSWITKVDTGNSEHVEIDLSATDSALNKTVQALTIGEMKGNAMFTMQLDGDRKVSDMLYMKKANGEYFINLKNAVTVEDMYNGFDGLRFATVGKGSHATFSAGTYGNGVYNVEYEVGTDDYATSTENKAYNSTANDGQMDAAKPGNALVDNLFKDEPQEAAANGIMTLAAVDLPEATDSSDTTEDMGTNTGMNGEVLSDTTNFKLIDVKSTELSNAGKTIIDMSKVNYSNAIYMDRLNKRMGEARYIDGDEGLWVRIRHDRIGKSDAFRSKNTMMELGYDKRVDDREDGEHRRGFAIDYMRGTAEYHNVAGDGDVRRGGVWFYDTWLGNKGHYSDYVLKFGRLSNDFDIYSELGEKITGDYSNFVYSASAEYGRKKDIGKDWYFEPQVQLQYAHVTDDDYTTSQGTSVELDAIDSLIGRVGFRLGKDMGENNTFYVKADVLHEFLGDQDISAFDATGRLDTTYENEGTWYDVGLGFSHQFSKGTYMFLDVEKTFGNDNEDTYQFNVGMNWKV